jgi:hypothetical protein
MYGDGTYVILRGQSVISSENDPLKPSVHYIYHQFNIQQFRVLPTQCVCVCVWTSEQTAIISYTTLIDWFL